MKGNSPGALGPKPLKQNYFMRIILLSTMILVEVWLLLITMEKPGGHYMILHS